MEILFRRPELDDRETILKHLSERRLRGCERTFANVYLWARFYNEGWAEIEGTAVFRTGPEGAYSYTYPIGAGAVSDTHLLNGMKADDAVETILNLFSRTKDNKEFAQNAKQTRFF